MLLFPFNISEINDIVKRHNELTDNLKQTVIYKIINVQEGLNTYTQKIVEVEDVAITAGRNFETHKLMSVMCIVYNVIDVSTKEEVSTLYKLFIPVEYLYDQEVFNEHIEDIISYTNRVLDEEKEQLKQSQLDN